MLKLTAFTGIILNAAVFGFFYAWVCSTMWGLDAADPNVAIKAMQAMNASVRNIVFAPAFFATPFVLVLAGLLAHRLNIKDVAIWFGLAGVIYLFAGMILTIVINVPMNQALALVDVTNLGADAKAVWQAFSIKWQFWNQARTIASGIALLMACVGLYRLGYASARQQMAQN